MRNSGVMRIRWVPACVVPLLAVGLLTGCSEETGSVTVEIRSLVPGTDTSTYRVSAVHADDGLIHSDDLGPGQTYTAENVRLGWVTLSADPRCTVESELTAEHPTMRLIVDGTDCTLAD